MNVRTADHIIAKGTRAEWEEVVDDLQALLDDNDISDSAHYLLINLRSALK